MRILGVYMKNIRSYPEGVVVFPPDGITVIYGPTGSGKTSILMSISHALFGFPPGSKREIFEAYEQPTGKDLLRAGTSEGCVRLLLSIGGKLHLIERRLRRLDENRYEFAGGLVEEYTIDKETGNVKRVKATPYSSRVDLDNKIAEIIGIKERTSQTGAVRATVFTSALYVPQFNVHEILEYNPEQRRDIVEKAFGLDKYKIARKNLDRIAEKLKSKIDNLEGSIQQIMHQLNRYEKRQLTRKAEELRLKLEELNKELEGVKSEIESSKRRAGELRKELEELSKQEYELKGVINQYEKMLANLRELEIKVKSRVHELSKEFGVEVEFGDQPIDKLLEEILTLIDEKRREILGKKAELEKKLTNLDKQVQELLDKERRASEQRGVLQGLLNSALRKLNELREELSSREKLVSSGVCPLCKQPIPHEHGIKLVQQICENVKSLELEVEKLTKEIKNLEEDMKALSKQIVKTKEEYTETQTLIKSQDEKLRELEKATAELHTHAENIAKLYKSAQSINIEEVKSKLEEVLLKASKTRADLKEEEELLKTLEKRVEELRENKVQIMASIKVIEERLLQIERLEKELTEKVARRDSLRKLQEYLQEVSRVIDVVEQEVTRIIASGFKEEFSKYVGILMEEQPVEVVATDDFGVEFKVLVDGKPYTTGALSGGQSIALSLAYRLALNATVRKYSPLLKRSVLILDEPTTGFSRDLVARLRALLEDLSKSGLGQVIVVTHDDTLVEVGDCKIRLELNPSKLESVVHYEECVLQGMNFDDYRNLVEGLLRGKYRTTVAQQRS